MHCFDQTISPQTKITSDIFHFIFAMTMRKIGNHGLGE
jgi:hypothetical protein